MIFHNFWQAQSKVPNKWFFFWLLVVETWNSQPQKKKKNPFTQISHIETPHFPDKRLNKKMLKKELWKN